MPRVGLDHLIHPFYRLWRKVHVCQGDKDCILPFQINDNTKNKVDWVNIDLVEISFKTQWIKAKQCSVGWHTICLFPSKTPSGFLNVVWISRTSGICQAHILSSDIIICVSCYLLIPVVCASTPKDESDQPHLIRQCQTWEYCEYMCMCVCALNLCFWW